MKLPLHIWNSKQYQEIIQGLEQWGHVKFLTAADKCQNTADSTCQNSESNSEQEMSIQGIIVIILVCSCFQLEEGNAKFHNMNIVTVTSSS